MEVMFEFRDPKSLHTLEDAREYAAAANRALLTKPMRKTTVPLIIMWLFGGLSYVAFLSACGLFGAPNVSLSVIWLMHFGYLAAACSCGVIAAILRDK